MFASRVFTGEGRHVSVSTVQQFVQCAHAASVRSSSADRPSGHCFLIHCKQAISLVASKRDLTSFSTSSCALQFGADLSGAAIMRLQPVTQHLVRSPRLMASSSRAALGARLDGSTAQSTHLLAPSRAWSAAGRGAPRSPVPGGQTTGPARSSYFARRTPPAAGHVRPAASAPLDQCGCVCARGAGRCRTRVLRSAPHSELATSVPAHQSVRPRLMLRRQCRQLGGQMRAPQRVT